MKDKINVNTQPLTFLDLLAIVFIVLKLTHVVDWSWWIVLAPIWGALVIAIVIVIIAYILGKS